MLITNMNYFRKYSSNFGLKYDFLSSMVVNDKCWLYFKFKTICFLLNKHKKYDTNSCIHAHIISNYSIHFENFLQTKIFENAIQSEMVLTHLRYDITLHASHLDGYMAHIYIYCLVQFGALWFEFIPHSIQYFCSSLPIFKLPQIQQRALLFSVVIIVLNGNNTVLIQDPEHFMDTFSKQLQITKR